MMGLDLQDTAIFVDIRDREVVNVPRSAAGPGIFGLSEHGDATPFTLESIITADQNDFCGFIGSTSAMTGY